MKILAVIVLTASLALPATDTRIYEMSVLLKPFRINADNERIYIGDGPQIHIYSRKDMSPLAVFGRAGEGPREFRLRPEFSPELDIQPDGILVNSIQKISFFSKEGKFIWEKKAPGFMLEQFHRIQDKTLIAQRLESAGDGFDLVYKLCDLDFSNEQIFHRHRYFWSRGEYNPIARGIYISNFYVYDGRIYIGGAVESGTIHVYDLSGNALAPIKPIFQRVPFTDKDRQGWIDSFMVNDEYKMQYQRLKDRMVYPDLFPCFQNFIVADDRIYLQTYRREDRRGTNELLIVNLQGEIVSKTQIPLVELFDFTPMPYTIHDKTLYHVIENADSEICELHVTPIQ